MGQTYKQSQLGAGVKPNQCPTLQQRQRYLLQDQYGFQPDLILALEKGSLVPASQLELGEQLMREFKNEALKKALDALQRPLNIWAKKGVLLGKAS